VDWQNCSSKAHPGCIDEFIIKKTSTRANAFAARFIFFDTANTPCFIISHNASVGTQKYM